MTQLQQHLADLGEERYARFQAGLVPGISKPFLGVRVPVLRRFAKTFAKEPDCEAFLKALPHQTYDEDLLHAILLGYEKQPERCLERIDAFAPYIDNWAVCDTIRPPCLKHNKPALLHCIGLWLNSQQPFVCRLAIELLMLYFSDADFRPAYLKWVAAVNREDYYVRMMQAWYFTTALSKQWEQTVVYLTENRLDRWIHNKTIQKAVESYCFTDEQKAVLRSLRR